MVENGKPAPDLFLLARCGDERRSDPCLVVEDGVAGVPAGKAAGMTVLGFTGGSHVDAESHARRLRAGADDILVRMADL